MTIKEEIPMQGGRNKNKSEKFWDQREEDEFCWALWGRKNNL